ncbi:MAG: hypothetical protein OEM38_07215 [Gammaproteobacteria bacterium]|nr:hypothetical protein [Gammaproteobacteria bacterium]
MKNPIKKIISNNFLLLLLTCSITVDAQELVSGSVIGRHIFGLATDYQGDPVLIKDSPAIYKRSLFDEKISIENHSIMVSVLNESNKNNDSIAGVYITQLEPKTNRPLDTVALDLSTIGGLSSPGGFTRTKWNSILVTESGIFNSVHPSEFIDIFKPYYKGKSKLVNPYNYGWVSEIIALSSQGQGKAKAIKNYAVGRLFANQVILMPDGKTIYLLDKIGNLYLFISEQANSLVKGELYVINRQQGQIKHTSLGKTSALKVKFKLKKITFDSLFQASKPINQGCSKKFKYIKTIYGEECLKLKPRNKKYTAVFEPIRSMALQGISSFTTENSRMEFNAENNQLIIEHTDKTKIYLDFDPKQDQNQNHKLNSQFIIKETK